MRAMLVISAYKWASNPQDATVGPDGRVDLSRAQAALSEYDPVAFEVGEALATATHGELVGLTVGPAAAASPLATKGVASRGPARLVVVADDSLAHLDPSSTATVLAEQVRALGGDVVLTGASSIDLAAGLVPAALAAELGWPCILDAAAVEADGERLRVTRMRDGREEVLAVATPAVIALASDAAKPRIPGMKDILAAGKKPVEKPVATAPDPRYELVATARPQLRARKQKIISQADPAAAAAELVAALRADGVL